MTTSPSFISLGDPTRLAALTEEQREDISRRLGEVNDMLVGIVADIDAWMPRQVEPEPVPEPEPQPVQRLCAWCEKGATGTKRMVLLGIDLGMVPTCQDPEHHTYS